jgi:lysophospholipase L1-like esterase
MKFEMILCAALVGAGQSSAQTTSPAATAQQACPAQANQLQQIQVRLADWAQLDRYRAKDAMLPPPTHGKKRVVFLGDSITDGWGHGGAFFPGRPFVNRGISGQTTPEMLLRFQQDVIHLHPAAVVILGGTNDVAGNTGPSTPEMIEDNYISMAVIARQSDIKVIFASILPAAAYPWKPGMHPADEIRTLNTWLQAYSQQHGYVYLDYYSSLADAQGGMRPGLSVDGVHPNTQGYAIMAPLAERAITQALSH